MAAAKVIQPQRSYPIPASTVNNKNGMNRQTSFTGVDELMNSPSPVEGSVAHGVTIARSEVQSSDSVLTSDTSNPSSNRSDLDMNIVDEVPLPEEEEQEDMEVFGHEKNKFEEDGDSDGMLGGVFAFSEEC